VGTNLLVIPISNKLVTTNKFLVQNATVGFSENQMRLLEPVVKLESFCARGFFIIAIIIFLKKS